MLSPEEINEIKEEIKHFPFPEACCIDALKIVQSHRGWISDEAVKDIADLLGMTASEIDSRATFYTRIYRRPVGRNVIILCDSVSCMVMGYENIYAHLQTRLGISFGETTKDNRFTLLPVTCLGDCHRAPAMIVNQDLHDELTLAKVDDILNKYS